MGKFTSEDLGTQNIDFSLERNNMDDLRNVKHGSVAHRAATTTNPPVTDEEVSPIATDASLPLQSPGGTSTGSISTANNTNTNSVVSSDAHSVSSGSDLADSTKVDPEVLLAQIRYQVEFYFSQQNLNRDTYMQEQMDDEGYIPIKTIANFKQVKRLTTSLDLILQAIGNSSICTINETGDMIKASWKRPARTTIIIREAGDNVSETDIRDLLEGTDFKIVSVRSDVAQTWFVTMDSEDDAKNALLYIIGKTLNGQRIKARLKSETLPAPAPAPPVFPVNDLAVPFAGQSGPQQYFGGYQVPQPNMNYNMMNYNPNHMSQWNPNMAYPGYDQSQVAPNADNSTSHLMMNSTHQALGADGSGLMKPQQPPKAPRGPQRTGSGEGGNRRRTNGNMMNASAGKPSQMMATKKKKAPVTKRIKTPVFQAYDFPSLPMGKINLEAAAEGETAESGGDTEVKPTTAAPSPRPTSSPGGASWAAAVAKAPSPPKVKPAVASPLPNGKAIQSKQPPGAKTSGVNQPKGSLAREQHKSSNDRSRVPAKGLKVKQPVKVAHVQPQREIESGPPVQQTPRPKRGWEKPGLTPVVPKPEPQTENGEEAKGPVTETKSAVEAKKIEGANQGQVQPKTLEREAEQTEMKEKVKPSLGAWGTKKSFADIIKGSGEQPPVKVVATPAPTQPAPEPSKGVQQLSHKKSPVKTMNNGFGRSRGSSIDGDWRRKDPQKINVHGK